MKDTSNVCVGDSPSNGRNHPEQVLSEDNCSFNSASTDSTRPTVHTNKHRENSVPSATSTTGGVRSPRSSHPANDNQGNNHNQQQISSTTTTNKNHGKGNNRQRVPGGAAAKLMLRGPQKSASSDITDGDCHQQNNHRSDSVGVNGADNEEEVDQGVVDTSDILDVLTKTKQEFELGPLAVNRPRGVDGNPPITIDVINGMEEGEEIEVAFHCFSESSPRSRVTTETEGSQQRESEKGSLPQILSREEGYHENASVAVAAILTPTSRGGGGSVLGETSSMVSGGSDQPSIRSNACSPHSHLSSASRTSAFRSPKFDDNVATNTDYSRMNISMRSVGSNDGSSRAPTPSSKTNNGDIDSQGNFFKSPTSAPLISDETAAKLDKMSAKLLDPSKTLSDLLRAIASPIDKTQIDRAYMVRRKNACGALKVLTAHNRRRKQICWTVGVLPALASVLQDAGEGSLETTYPDTRTRMEYEETRLRAIAALTNLAMAVPNRLAVFHTPGLVQSLIGLVQNEKGECLEGACAILAYLAKSNENRILMAQVPGLFEAVLRVLKPGDLDRHQVQAKEGDSLKQSSDLPWTSSVSASDNSSVSTADEEDRSFMSGSTHTSSEGEDSFDEDDLERNDTAANDEEESLGEADFTDDDDMSTDGEESMTGSEVSGGSSMSESSGEESGSEYHPPPPTTISPKNRKIKASNSSQSKSSLPTGASKCKMNSNYDRDKHMAGARKNLFAMLGHLVKEKDNAVS